MAKKITKKQTKNGCTNAFKIAICALSVLVVLLGITVVCLVFKSASNEEKDKRNAVFENLAMSYITKLPIADELDGEYNANIAYKGTGLSEDGDVYIDFTVYYYEKGGNYAPVKAQDGRLHFQGDYYNNVNNDPDEYRFAHAIWYGDEYEVSE